MVVHETKWDATVKQLLRFRQRMRTAYALPLRAEIHASAFINSPGALRCIKRHDRLAILRDHADEIASMPHLRLINVVVDKNSKTTGYDVFDTAWKILIQRLDNTITHHNFPESHNPDERATLYPDNTDNKKLLRISRRMRAYNPVPHDSSLMTDGYRRLEIQNVIEDPNFRDSATSVMIQAVDTCAYMLSQHLRPNAYMRKKSGYNYFHRLAPILLTQASRSDPMGIVRV